MGIGHWALGAGKEKYFIPLLCSRSVRFALTLFMVSLAKVNVLEIKPQMNTDNSSVFICGSFFSYSHFCKKFI
ncbi:hypothetical protein [aff. Roholtiella sp. LEGE 12411]|uniref:hypothetical protein n=1 Tax=aff. Roholtiella sp. LEGE 12411 TaxID=1828822 RepID=UPI0030D7F59D